MKTTESHIYSAFIMLANTLKKPVYIGESTLKKLRKSNKYFNEPNVLVDKYLTVGAWSLAKSYHGYQIEEMGNEGGGISHPLTSNAMKSTQFYDALHFALSVIRFQQNEARRGEV
jgi:hypothetical protein